MNSYASKTNSAKKAIIWSHIFFWLKLALKPSIYFFLLSMFKRLLKTQIVFEERAHALGFILLSNKPLYFQKSFNE